MEIADIFVVNKADREGADRTVASIEAVLSLQTFDEGQWRPPIVKTEATTGTGVGELIEAISRFRTQAGGHTAERRRAWAAYRVRELLGQQFIGHVERHVLEPGELERLVDRIERRETDPYSAVETILARTIPASPRGGRP